MILTGLMLAKSSILQYNTSGHQGQGDNGQGQRKAWFHYAHTSSSMATSQDDVFMLKDNTVILEDGEMNEIDRELEEFK